MSRWFRSAIHQVALDFSGRIILVDEKFTRLTTYSSSYLTGKPFAVYLENREGFYRILEQLKCSDNSISTEKLTTRLVTANGLKQCVEMRFELDPFDIQINVSFKSMREDEMAIHQENVA